jgi:hypothetical protein
MSFINKYRKVWSSEGNKDRLSVTEQIEERGQKVEKRRRRRKKKKKIGIGGEAVCRQTKLWGRTKRGCLLENAAHVCLTLP